MRLRYLRLVDVPPLHDVHMVFRQEPILQRACAIRFVVGVNGTGKTRLLQALAQSFLSLERRQLPPFPVTLAYDLGTGERARTLLFNIPRVDRKRATLVEFNEILAERSEDEWETLANTEWETGPLFRSQVRSIFQGGDLPGIAAIGAFLPRVLLAYSSGATASWGEIFAPVTEEIDTELLQQLAMNDAGEIEERPAGWTVEQEIMHQRRLGNVDQASALEAAVQAPPADSSLPSIAQLVTADALPLAVCAITMQQMVLEFREEGTQNSLRAAVEQSLM